MRRARAPLGWVPPCRLCILACAEHQPSCERLPSEGDARAPSNHPGVVVDLVIEVPDLGEGVPKVPSWRHIDALVRDGAQAEPAANRIAPIRHAAETRRLALAVAIQIFADEGSLMASLLEPQRKRVFFLVLESAPAAALILLVRLDAVVV